MQKLLLLEDDVSLIDGLTYSLVKNGFDVEVARTIGEAKKRIAENAGFDLFLFDVTLTETDLHCAKSSAPPAARFRSYF